MKICALDVADLFLFQVCQVTYALLFPEPEQGLLTDQLLWWDPNGVMLYQMTLKPVQMKQASETN